MLTKDTFWTSKYRPKTLSEMSLPDRLQKRFQNGLDCNILLAGVSGNGKTTLARILAEPYSTLFIDGSTETGIDVVREKIVGFCTTSSILKSGKKVVLIDEIDGFSIQAQKSLKVITEKHERDAYFVFTSNHPNKIIEQLHSRFEYVDFNFSDVELSKQKINYLKHIQKISKLEGLKIQKEVYNYLITEVYPDMRKIIGLLYSANKMATDGMITIDLMKSVKSNQDGEDMYTFLMNPKNNNNTIYEFCKKNYLNSESSVFLELGEPFLEHLNKQPNYSEKVLAVAMLNHKYSYESTVGKVPVFITLLALMSAIHDVLHN